MKSLLMIVLIIGSFSAFAQTLRTVSTETFDPSVILYNKKVKSDFAVRGNPVNTYEYYYFNDQCRILQEKMASEYPTVTFSYPEYSISDLSFSSKIFLERNGTTWANGALEYNFYCQISFTNHNPNFKFKKTSFKLDGQKCNVALPVAKQFVKENNLTDVVDLSIVGDMSYPRSERRATGYSSGCAIQLIQIEKY